MFEVVLDFNLNKEGRKEGRKKGRKKGVYFKKIGLK